MTKRESKPVYGSI